MAQFWQRWHIGTAGGSPCPRACALRMSQEGNVFLPLHQGKYSAQRFAGEFAITSNGLAPTPSPAPLILPRWVARGGAGATGHPHHFSSRRCPSALSVVPGSSHRLQGPHCSHVPHQRPQGEGLPVPAWQGVPKCKKGFGLLNF